MLSFLLIYFLTRLLLELSTSTSSRIDPFRFQAAEVVGGDQTWLVILC